MANDIKKRILDAASTVARTKESECTGVPDLLRRRIDLWFDACEELIPEKVEILKWIDVRDEMPEDFQDVLIVGTLAQDDETLCVWLGYYDDKLWWDCAANELEKVTHWAEIPKGPVKVTV